MPPSAAEWPTSGSHLFFDDVAGHAEVFNSGKNAARMFTKGNILDVEVCVIGSPAWPTRTIKDLDGLRECLEQMDLRQVPNSNVAAASARIFFIPLKHSRSEMSLTREAMTLILHKVQVFPAFVNIISSIGLLTRETTSSITGFSAFYGTIDEDISIFETAYMLKYVEPNGLPHGDPWSIRHMDIYQRYNYSTNFSDSILIHLSTQVKIRLSQLMRDGHISRLPNHWTNLHEIILGTLSHNWPAYIAEIEIKLSKVDFNYFFTHVEADEPQRLHFEDLKVLNQGIDILSRMSHALQLNIDVLNLLSEEATRRAATEGERKKRVYSKFQQNLRTCITEQKFHKSHVSLLQTFADRRSSQLRDAIALQDSNITMTLNQKTIRETQTMRTITLVALVYLPASFTATFLSMGFVHVTSLGGVMGVSVSQDMWFYLAITLPLMVLTFLAWGVWEWRMRRKKLRMVKHEGPGLAEKD